MGNIFIPTNKKTIERFERLWAQKEKYASKYMFYIFKNFWYFKKGGIPPNKYRKYKKYMSVYVSYTKKVNKRLKSWERNYYLVRKENGSVSLCIAEK